MSDNCSLSTDGNTIVLSGVLDFHTVVDVDRHGMQWLSTEAPVQCRLDLAGVTYSNSAGVALVLGWLRTAHAANKQLSIGNMPESMVTIALLGGLDAILPLERAGSTKSPNADEPTPPPCNE